MLEKEFGGKLKKSPFRFGSTEKGTALSKDFDIDICLSFVPNAYSSIPMMYDTVLDFLQNPQGVNGIIRVRDQKKSIGIFFVIDGSEYKIDILPQKISKSKGNKTSGYLYVNRKGLFEKSSRTKTDITLLNSITLNEPQKKILITLKRWKQNEGISISSHFVAIPYYRCL